MRKFFRKYLPDSARVREYRVVAAFGSTLQHPNLWHLNRDSVAKGVAIGLFTGLVPGPFQILGGLLLAIPLRANIPVMVFSTFYTNPFTIVPLYLAAYEYGRLLLGEGHGGPTVEPFIMDWANFRDSMEALALWALALGKPLGVGLVALALSLALAGYAVVQLAWRAGVVLAWRARKRRQARKPGA